MIEINDGNYQDLVLNSSEPFLLDFSATWCGPCQQLKPILKELEVELAGKAKIGMVDIDQSQSLARQHSVTSVPTLLLFQNGQVKERLLGVQPKRVLIDKINSVEG